MDLDVSTTFTTSCLRNYPLLSYLPEFSGNSVYYMNVKQMDAHFAQPIGFMTCSGDSLFLLLILLFFMSMTLILLNLFVYSQYYQHSNSCNPVLFYFGQKEGCKQTINSWANIHSIKTAYNGNLPKNVIDKTTTSKPTDKPKTCKIELFENNTNNHPWNLQQWFSQIWNNYLDILENIINSIHEIKYRLFAEFVYPNLSGYFVPL